MLRSGDIGFINEGERFVLARAGDTIRFNGRTIYPNIIASAINGSVQGLLKGSTTGYFDKGSSKLAVALEMQRKVYLHLMSVTAKILEYL